MEMRSTERFLDTWEFVQNRRLKGDEFLYGIGCNASDIEGVPEGFEVIHIPEYTWAVFKCVGPSPDAIQNMWERIYKECYRTVESLFCSPFLLCANPSNIIRSSVLIWGLFFKK